MLRSIEQRWASLWAEVKASDHPTPYRRGQQQLLEYRRWRLIQGGGFPYTVGTVKLLARGRSQTNEADFRQQLRYCSQPLLAAARIRPRCQPQPGGEVTPGFETRQVRNKCLDRGRRDRSNTRYRICWPGRCVPGALSAPAVTGPWNQWHDPMYLKSPGLARAKITI